MRERFYGFLIYSPFFANFLKAFDVWLCGFGSSPVLLSLQIETRSQEERPVASLPRRIICNRFITNLT